MQLLLLQVPRDVSRQLGQDIRDRSAARLCSLPLCRPNQAQASENFRESV